MADEVVDLPSYEDLGEPTDLSAAEASMVAAEASALPTSMAEEDWVEEEDEDEEEVEEEEPTVDGLVEPSLQDIPRRTREQEEKRRKRVAMEDLFANANLQNSSEDESWAPEREEDDEGGDTGMRQFIEGPRYAMRNEAWPKLLKILQDPPVDDPHEPGLQDAALRFQNFASQLGQRSFQLRKPDPFGRSMLHLALMRHRPDVVRAILTVEDQDEVMDLVNRPFETSGDSDSQKDVIPCVHLALSGVRFREAAESLQCLQLLLDQAVALVSQVDNSGRSGLHVACALGSSRAAEMLLENNADPGLQDDYGFMPLHYAIDSRNLDCVKQMIQVSDQTSFSGELNPWCRCIDRSAWDAALLLCRERWPLAEGDIGFLFDFAQMRGLNKEWNFVAEAMLSEGVVTSAMEEVMWPEIFKETYTLAVTHATCGRHGMLPEETDDPSMRYLCMSNIPENPHRLEVLCGENGLLRSELFRDLRWSNEPHAAPIVDVLRVHEFWYVQKLMERVEKVRHFRGLNGPPMPIDSGDTKVSPDSWSAALCAAGAVLEAVDQVCGESARNAFCAVRPPGHHLGPGGAVDKKDLDDDPEGSQGFCLLNNVAIGAAYAKCVYRHFIRKVAIIDFDVHHGNGTEAIVRNLKYRPKPKVNSKQELKFGWTTIRFLHEMEKPPSCKPWLDGSDVENVFFASIHGFGAGFYPGTGGSCSQTGPRIINVPLRKNSGPAEFRKGMRRHILPQLHEFHPDLIFISAGFDGHEDDLLGCCRLSEEDYIWATQQLMAIANRCCNGRLVSVLEGGYNTRGEVLSPFASAVGSHVRTLMYTSPNYNYLDWEVVMEGQNLEENETFIQRVEEMYSADWHNDIRREEARRLRLKKRLAEEVFGDSNFEPPMKVQRQEAEEQVRDPPEAQAEAAETESKEESEFKDMKEEKVDLEKDVEMAQEEEPEAPRFAEDAVEAPEEPEVDAPPMVSDTALNEDPQVETLEEAELPEADSQADLGDAEGPEAEAELDAAEETYVEVSHPGDGVALQAIEEVAKTEGEEALDPKVLEDCELMVEATDHFLHNVDLQKVESEEQAEEVPWEGE